MKDFNARYLSKAAIYKKVVVIGNGPSGISLSYMLSGHWPYWQKDLIQRHPDELLRARLEYSNNDKSIIEQDLELLAEGLEGRTTNPVSLLYDSLQNPCADIGLVLPSMLEFKYHPDKKIDHVVLGKDMPGGSWHRMDPNLRTLSLSGWMSLPSYDYNTWEEKQKKKQIETLRKSVLNPQTALYSEIESIGDSDLNKIEKPDKTSTVNDNQKILNELTTVPKRNLSLKRQVSKDVQTRALVSRVAQYYNDYVNEMNLNEYFINDFTVKMILPIKGKHIYYPQARWVVFGINNVTGKPITYACESVVLANGASDLPNHLGIQGEDNDISWIKYDLPSLESDLEKLSISERKSLKPVVIVGAGLSAADGVTICRSSDIPVIHVFRNKSVGLDKTLPENVYPEYHEVHKMMRDSKTQYDFYTALPEHTILNVISNNLPNGPHKLIVQHLKTGETQELEVSYCAILIGSRPDLRLVSQVNLNHSDVPSFNELEMKHCPIIGDEKRIDDQQYNTMLGKKLSWLKGFCAKCKSINFCDWSRRSEYKRINGFNQSTMCECKWRKYYEKYLKSQFRVLTEYTGIGLGEDPNKPIDCKNNPICVNKYTNEVERVPKGLYAMGPLVGDNFVRFIPGGAVAITSAFYKEND